MWWAVTEVKLSGPRQLMSWNCSKSWKGQPPLLCRGVQPGRLGIDGHPWALWLCLQTLTDFSIEKYRKVKDSGTLLFQLLLYLLALLLVVGKDSTDCFEKCYTKNANQSFLHSENVFCIRISSWNCWKNEICFLGFRLFPFYRKKALLDFSMK